ncbi:MAG TPA: 3-(cis-5,6-dihydroxycyclohexa-1,3-dien-1-yl)propanoate dehydrogenase [Solirubrobacteraceae bacterium]|jgi:2,3-dihydroxy-2,3-dihydrophenylpropionate dehydrogenase|nr:3-(cis-5,6-dihydroxycyclohexa-1,3-dien-1-yl)propanoate dehydrogenase [Solirubrobacteraceae bacterium]
MGWLSEKSVLVTGGGSGIGRGVVDAFVAEGARVGVLDIVAEKLAAISADHGDAVAVIEGDATDLAANEHAVAATAEAFGGVDVLVCCQGVWDYFTSIVDLPADKLAASFDELFSLNVKSYLLGVKAALPQLLEREGNIVLTVSNAGFYPAGGGSLYTGSKFAVRGLIVQLAYELSPKVRVNGVAPGGTPTALRGLSTLGMEGMRLQDIPDVEALIQTTNPLQVVPTPADHAWAYLLLASRERTRSITGTIIHSDGGLGSRGLTQVSGLVEPAAAE